MDSGEYIADRLIEHIIPEVANEIGAICEEFSDGWVFQLRLGDKVGDVFGYRFSCNTVTAASIARDKVATSAVLLSRDIATSHHTLTYNRHGEITRYEDVEGEVVVKPLQGASGYGVRRFDSQAEAELYMASSSQVAWAVAPWYDITSETRVIILDEEVLLSYRKQAVVKDNLKMFNLGLGATAVDAELPDEMRQLAVNAMRVLHLRLAAVDIVVLTDGTMRVLEVNDGIMMEHYMRSDDNHRHRGYDVYKKILKTMLE